MRFRLRTLLIVLVVAPALLGLAWWLYFGNGPPSSEVGRSLQSKLQKATHVVIHYSELDGKSNVAYVIDDTAQVQRLIPHFVGYRRWREIGPGGWSTLEIAFVEFRDSKDATLWSCTLLPNSVEFTAKDGRTWLGRYPGGLRRVMSVAKRSNQTVP